MGVPPTSMGVSQMAALGSVPERREFFRTRAKPPRPFRDRAPARLMAAGGWIVLKNSRIVTWRLNFGNFHSPENASTYLCCLNKA